MILLVKFIKHQLKDHYCITQVLSDQGCMINQATRVPRRGMALFLLESLEYFVRTDRRNLIVSIFAGEVGQAPRL